MFVYSWPASIIKKLETWMRNFIWSGCIDNKKFVTVAWRNCCKRMDEEVLRILSLKAYNFATNVHLCWKLLNNNQNWSNIPNARVRRNGEVTKYSIKSSHLSGIKEAYDLVMENCIWIIGNGNKVNFWLDNWLGESLASKFNVRDIFHKNLTSMVCYWWTPQGWYVNANIQMALPNLLSTISYVAIPDFNVEDTLV